MGRLSKDKVVKALNETKGGVYLAAKMLGCSHTAVYKYVNNYPEVKLIKDFYDGEMVDIGELELRNAVKNGDPWAVKYLLSTKGKTRGYVERQELTGADGDGITVKVIKGIDPDKL